MRTALRSFRSGFWFAAALLSLAPISARSQDAGCESGASTGSHEDLFRQLEEALAPKVFDEHQVGRVENPDGSVRTSESHKTGSSYSEKIEACLARIPKLKYDTLLPTTLRPPQNGPITAAALQSAKRMKALPGASSLSDAREYQSLLNDLTAETLVQPLYPLFSKMGATVDEARHAMEHIRRVDDGSTGTPGFGMDHQVIQVIARELQTANRWTRILLAQKNLTEWPAEVRADMDRGGDVAFKAQMGSPEFWLGRTYPLFYADHELGTAKTAFLMGIESAVCDPIFQKDFPVVEAAFLLIESSTRFIEDILKRADTGREDRNDPTTFNTFDLAHDIFIDEARRDVALALRNLALVDPELAVKVGRRYYAALHRAKNHPAVIASIGEPYGPYEETYRGWIKAGTCGPSGSGLRSCISQ